MAGFNDLTGAQAPSVVYQDLTLPAGGSWSVGWTAYDSLGNAIDFSGATARCDIRTLETWELVATWTDTVTDGREITLDSAGNVIIKATPAATATLVSDKDIIGVYELEITNDGNTVKFARGQIMIPREVTTSG